MSRTRSALALFAASLVAASCGRAARHEAPAAGARPLAPATTHAAEAPAAAHTRAFTGVVTVHADARDTPGAQLAVHIPAGLPLDAPLNVVVFFHGSDMCAARFIWPGAFDRALCPHPGPVEVGSGGASRHDDAQTRSILVVPQLFTGRDRRFGERGYFRALLEALLRGPLAPHLGRPRGVADVDRVVLMAHSLGNRVLDHVLRDGGIAPRVTGIALLDGVMDGAAPYLSWLAGATAERPRRIAALYAGVAAARTGSLALARAWARQHPGDVTLAAEPLSAAIRAHTVSVIHSPYPHGWIDLLYFTKALAAMDLPRREVPDAWEYAAPTRLEPVAIGADVAGQLAPPNAREGNAPRFRDYALELGAGACAEVVLEGGRAPVGPAPVDTRLLVFRRGAVVVDDDDGAAAGHAGRGCFDSRATLCASEPERYVLRATTFSGYNGGPYHLRVRAMPPPGSSHAP